MTLADQHAIAAARTVAYRQRLHGQATAAALLAALVAADLRPLEVPVRGAA